MDAATHHARQARGWLRDWLDEVGTVVLTPRRFFADHRHGYGHAVRFAVTTGVVGAVLQVLALLVLTGLHILPPPPQITALPTQPVPRLLLGVGGAVGSGVAAGTLGLFFLAGILHLSVKLLGGTGFERTVSVVGHATAVNAAFGWLLATTTVGGLLTAGYWTYITAQGLSAVHGFSRMRAAFAVILPLLIGTLLAAAAVGFATLRFLATI